jgi:hypothetical protein
VPPAGITIDENTSVRYELDKDSDGYVNNALYCEINYQGNVALYCKTVPTGDISVRLYFSQVERIGTEKVLYGLSNENDLTAYIDTGYAFTENLDVRTEVVFRHLTTNVGNSNICGMYGSASNRVNWIGIAGTSVGVGIGSVTMASNAGIIPIAQTNVKNKILVDSNVTTMTQDIYLNGEFERTKEFTGSLTHATHGYQIFDVPSYSSGWGRRAQVIYGLKLWHGGTLVRNMIPVPMGDTQYSSTPAPAHGMWDTVTQQYYTNARTNPGDGFSIVDA